MYLPPPKVSDSFSSQEWDPKICIFNKLGTTLGEPLHFIILVIVS